MRTHMKRSGWRAAALVVGLAPALALAGDFKAYRIPTDNADPREIVLGPDGAMWFTEPELNVSQIGRVNARGRITEYGLDPISSLTPIGIASTPDGNLWFTELNRNAIGRLQPTGSGVFTFFDVRTPNAGLAGIVLGPDGALWFGEPGANQTVKN